jgi:gliding motility-associated lipoprotein GldH
MKNFIFFLSLLILLLSSACTSPAFFDETKATPKEWSSKEKISFNVDVNDTLSAFNFFIQVRNTVDYSYSNVYFFVQTYFPDGRFARDTLNIWLANPEGKWLGKGYGSYRDREILFKQKGRFPMKGVYRFEFEQAMYNDKLTGIESIGIRIEYEEQ